MSREQTDKIRALELECASSVRCELILLDFYMESALELFDGLDCQDYSQLSDELLFDLVRAICPFTDPPPNETADQAALDRLTDLMPYLKDVHKHMALCHAMHGYTRCIDYLFDHDAPVSFDDFIDVKIRLLQPAVDNAVEVNRRRGAHADPVIFALTCSNDHDLAPEMIRRYYEQVRDTFDGSIEDFVCDYIEKQLSVFDPNMDCHTLGNDIDFFGIAIAFGVFDRVYNLIVDTVSKWPLSRLTQYICDLGYESDTDIQKFLSNPSLSYRCIFPRNLVLQRQLEYAVRHNLIPTLSAILQLEGVVMNHQLSSPWPFSPPEMIGKQCYSNALMRAVSHGNVQIVKLLLSSDRLLIGSVIEPLKYVDHCLDTIKNSPTETKKQRQFISHMMRIHPNLTEKHTLLADYVKAKQDNKLQVSVTKLQQFWRAKHAVVEPALTADAMTRSCSPKS